MRAQTTQPNRQKNSIKTRDHPSARTEGNSGTSMRALIILSGFYAIAESVLRERSLRRDKTGKLIIQRITYCLE